MVRVTSRTRSSVPSEGSFTSEAVSTMARHLPGFITSAALVASVRPTSSTARARSASGGSGVLTPAHST
eukprot:1412990-Prymnesium_polylepis.1